MPNDFQGIENQLSYIVEQLRIQEYKTQELFTAIERHAQAIDKLTNTVQAIAVAHFAHSSYSKAAEGELTELLARVNAGLGVWRVPHADS